MFEFKVLIGHTSCKFISNFMQKEEAAPIARDHILEKTGLRYLKPDLGVLTQVC